MILLRGALVVVALSLVWGEGAEAQRLAGGVRPEHYALTITPDLARARFTGSETIDLLLDAPTDKITLNAAELDFISVKAREADAAATLRTATVSLDKEKQQATFVFAHKLPAGRAALEIAYTGVLNDKLRGFYLSHTQRRSYGITQFEATDARRAFPSFDEPALKATFSLSLVIDSSDRAISNTPIVSDTSASVAGKHTVVFAMTPKMSTYLVAWLVGDFQCSEGRQDGVEIRVCATPEKVAMTKFALDAARWDLHYYDTYFGIHYPLPKLDLIAVSDFEEGAMENFGCITFRETDLLIDRKNDDLDARKQVAQTVAHELAHQWFGDLVTPAWWNDVWLNEGFATWMEEKAVANWQPRWGLAEDAALAKERAMSRDASAATHAVSAHVETPAEIDEIFDGITYDKAGAVIAMVEHWVGAEVFRKGVQAYLAEHAYGNATAENFWDAETAASGMPVDKVMRSFIDQPGVPLLILKGEGDAARGTQRRFLLSGESHRTAGEKQAWTIPLCLSGEPCRLLMPADSVGGDGSALLPLVQTNANADDKGYYRTEYRPPLLQKVEQEAETRLSAPERIGLVGDQWALVQAGESGAGTFLDLVLALKQDPSADVMELALDDVETIESKIATEDEQRGLEAVIRRVFAPVLAALGKQRHEPRDRGRLREVLFEALGHAQDPAVLAEAKEMTQQIFGAKKVADPALADAALALATADGDPAMYDGLMRAASNAADPHLREAALNSLTGFESAAEVKTTLDYAVSNAVRSQDSWTLIVRLLERRHTQDQAWTYVQEHWPEIMLKATANSTARIVDAAGAFCTVERRDQVAKFFRSHDTGSSPRALNRSLERIDECIHLRAAQEPALRRWLQQQRAVP